jgi:Rhodopirellula transposase DDE domain
MRTGIVHQCQCPHCKQGEPSLEKDLHTHMNLLLSTLDEKQRRLYAGLESQQLGYGGDQQVALITGLSVHTIAKGRGELAQLLPNARVRRPGAGQPAFEKTDPTILPALKKLLEDATAGDPQSSLKWRRPSLRHLRDALLPDHVVSASTLRRLLRDLGYSPKANRKRLGKSDPQRDEQFRYLHSQKALFLQQHRPVLSIDAKKRELIGLFKNSGTIWCREPCCVNVYDFRSLALGIGIPYGMYDIARNEGFVLVGTSGNTAEFAVDALGWWWRKFGRHHYPEATSLLLLADGGGNNGCRVRLWKYTLQHWFVNTTGLTVTVCHYPTGASKWNPIEHRLFSQISDNWAGQPLETYERMLHLIEGTITEQGLVVHGALTNQKYATKIKISDEQMAGLNLASHTVFPQWNYTIKPAIT